MGEKIGIGIVGTGFLSKHFAECYKTVPDVELVAVSSKTEEHANDFARKYGLKAWYTDYEKMMKHPDVDFVNVCVPNYLHAQVTISAAENGKHVLCTKPLAITLKEADEMVTACNRYDVKLMYGENWLFSPALIRVERIINEGALGKLLAVEAWEQHSGSHSPYSIRKEFSGGGVLIHMAVHPIGLAMHLINQPVRRVYAELGNLLHDIEVEDYAVLLMRFKDGGSGVIHSNYITKGGMQERVEIYGTEGAIFMNVTHGGPLCIYTDVGYSYVMEKASTTKGWTSPTLDEKWQFGFCNMINHFIRCLREEEECRSPGEFGKKVLEVVFAGYKSAEKGIAINLTG